MVKMINIIVNWALIFLSDQSESLFNHVLMILKKFKSFSFLKFYYVQEVMILWTLALSLISCWMESFCEYRSINTLKTEEYPR